MESTETGQKTGDQDQTERLNPYIEQPLEVAEKIARVLIERGLFKEPQANQLLQYKQKKKHLTFGEIIFLYSNMLPQAFLLAVSTSWIVLHPMELLMANGKITRDLWIKANAVREGLSAKKVQKNMERICMEDLGPEIGAQCRKILFPYSQANAQHAYYSDVFRHKSNTQSRAEEALGSIPKPSSLQEALLIENILKDSEIKQACHYMEGERWKSRIMTFAGAVVELELVKRDYLADYMEKNGYVQSIEVILMESWLITESQWEKAQISQTQQRIQWTVKSTEQILVEEKMLDNGKLEEAIAQQKLMRRIEPEMSKIVENDYLFFTFEREKMEELHFVPYDIEALYEGVGTKKKLCGFSIIVLSDSCTWEQANRIRREMGIKAPTIGGYLRKSLWNPKGTTQSLAVEIKFAYATPEEMGLLIRRCSKVASIIDTTKITGNQEHMNEDKTMLRVGDDFHTSNNPHVSTFLRIVRYALDARASDIHIDPEKNKLRVRIRVDGRLLDILELPEKDKEKFVMSIKQTCGFQDGMNRNIPTDAQHSVLYHDKNLHVGMRFAVVPLFGNPIDEKMTVRLHRDDETVSTFFELWMRPNTASILEKLCQKNGLTIVSGPTWGGKTRTLYSMIGGFGKDKNVMTVENPPEFRIPWTNQIRTNEKMWLTFAEALRANMRHNPDVIMIGEMRDIETALVAIQAGDTGHIVCTSTHGNTAAETYVRMYNMGIKPGVLSSSVNAIVCQRLVPKVCVQCREPYVPDPEDLNCAARCFSDLGDYIKEHKIQFYRGTGVHNGKECPCCSGTGYFWRALVMEVLPAIGEGVKKAVRSIEEKGATKIEKAARKECNMVGMKEDMIAHALAGRIKLEDGMEEIGASGFPSNVRSVSEVLHLLEGKLSPEEMNTAIFGKSQKPKKSKNHEQDGPVNAQILHQSNGSVTDGGNIFDYLSQELREVEKDLTVH